MRDFGSEAYTVQDGTHCEPAISQEIHEPSLRSLLGNPSLELVLINGPVPDPVRVFEPARVCQMGDEVAAKGTPQRAVLGGVDGALAGAEDEEADGRADASRWPRG